MSKQTKEKPTSPTDAIAHLPDLHKATIGVIIEMVRSDLELVVDHMENDDPCMAEHELLQAFLKINQIKELMDLLPADDRERALVFLSVYPGR